jgi:ABC-type amino acid transport substrate-binding protein
MNRWECWAVAATVVGVMSGCGLQIPADPDGTLDRVRGGTLHAGLSPNGEITEVDESGRVRGSEVSTVEAFAEELGADVDWTVGSEESLVRGLEDGQLDLVVAGLTDATPWEEKAGVTRPYTEVVGEDGARLRLVMLVPIGENAFLTELETFLSGTAEDTR